MLKYTEYELNENSVETISAALQEHLGRLGVERRSLQRLRLAAEELLLNVMEGLGPGVRIEVGLGKQLGRQILRLRYRGAPCDPTRSGENSWAEELMQTLGYYPSWSCKSGVNAVSLVLTERPRRSSLTNILIAVVAAIILGVLGNWLPESFRQSLDEILLAPIFQAFLGMMYTFSGLLIAFTICSGIIGMGNTANLEKVGKQFLLRFLLICFAACVTAELLALLFLHWNASAGAAGQGSPLSQISQMLFAILPSNPVEPFQTGNSIQIIVIALLVGIGLIAIGERGSRLCGLVNEGSALLQRIVSLICGFIPLFVFTMLLRTILSGKARELLSLWKLLVLAAGAEILVVSALFLLTFRRLKCPALLLLKKVLPAFLVALTTASSMSAMTLGMESCEKRLGIDRDTVAFAYPLGMVFFMPASSAAFMGIVCSFASIYQVEIGPAWFIIATIMVTLLVVAMPPIPGAGFMVYSVLLSNLGIPAEAMLLVTAAEVLLDFLNTGLNTMALLLQLARESARQGKLDRKALLAPQKI